MLSQAISGDVARPLTGLARVYEKRNAARLGWRRLTKFTATAANITPIRPRIWHQVRKILMKTASSAGG
jgi:hypothetical protein